MTGLVDPLLPSSSQSDASLRPAPLPIQISLSLSEEAKKFSNRYEKSMIVASAAIHTSLIAAGLNAIGLATVALGFSPIGWACIGLAVISILALVIAKCQYSGLNLTIQDQEKLAQERNKGIRLLIPFYGPYTWYKERNKESPLPLEKAPPDHPRPATPELLAEQPSPRQRPTLLPAPPRIPADDEISDIHSPIESGSPLPPPGVNIDFPHGEL